MAHPDKKRLKEALEKLQKCNFKNPSTHANSMGPDVSLSSIRYIDLTILRDVYWCDFSRFFSRDLMGFLGDFITISNLVQQLRKVHLSKKGKTPINRMEIQASLN